jgi:hypothetical protein
LLTSFASTFRFSNFTKQKKWQEEDTDAEAVAKEEGAEEPPNSGETPFGRRLRALFQTHTTL